MKYLLILCLLFPTIGLFQPAEPPTWDFDAQLNDYFTAKTLAIKDRTAAELSAMEDWPAYREQARAELQDMLGLSPWPERIPLQATVTGTVEHEDFVVEKVHFQSMPGLYVTGNLYIPKGLTKKAPAILYVCGHATVEKDGYNYGAKVHYQHHPAWFARHGYVCLILDTVQLGEIEGIHHGLHRYDRWWWLSQGYTPAGTETWNGIRAIDYLQSRPEVDVDRIGMTGRSGGGVTTWWVAALDERVKVAVPVAGITDMEDQVINGCVEGHCDCMFMFNTHRWDFPKIAALLAPRPLLISNTDRDPIFPLTGVYRTYRQVRSVYEKLDAGEQLALNITAGPHQDVQELRIHAFRWFDEYLQGRDELIERPAVKFFTPEQLRVFDELPADEVNTRIDESFNPTAPATREVLEAEGWPAAKKQWRESLATVFDHWPELPPAELESVKEQRRDGLSLTTYALPSDEHTRLPLFHLRAEAGRKSKTVRLVILDDENWDLWQERLAAVFPGDSLWEDVSAGESAAAALQSEMEATGDLLLLSVRGAGPARYAGNDFKQIQIRKRYYLLGETLHSMQTWDIRRAVEAILDLEIAWRSRPIQLAGSGQSAGKALYASLFVDRPLELQLTDLPDSHRQGPHYPKVLRYLDMPAALLLAGEKQAIRLQFTDADLRAAWQDQTALWDQQMPGLDIRDDL